MKAKELDGETIGLEREVKMVEREFQELMRGKEERVVAVAYSHSDERDDVTIDGIYDAMRAIEKDVIEIDV